MLSEHVHPLTSASDQPSAANPYTHFCRLPPLLVYIRLAHPSYTCTSGYSLGKIVRAYARTHETLRATSLAIGRQCRSFELLLLTFIKLGASKLCQTSAWESRVRPAQLGMAC